MTHPSAEQIEQLRTEFPVGSRVELVKMDDPYRTDLVPGTKGTVTCVDDSGSIHVNWDCHSSLAVIYGVDVCKIVHDSSIHFDPSDWDSMIDLMDKYGQVQDLPYGENENGETVLMDISHERIHVTTFQKNGWIRENTYWRDGTAEEEFSGKYEG